jgi:hypothetical protein
MTEIDEAIKNYEKAAEEKEKQAIWLWSKEGNPNYDNCIEVAKKLRQLAKWLRKLKAYEEVDEETCEEKMVEIVIKMDEEDYKRIQDIPDVFNSLASRTYSAIRNGTPLPKGHGRITDIDKVLEEMKATRTYDISFALERVKPIIEADKESESE